MREYKFKKGFKASEERLEELLRKFFGEFEKEGNEYVVRYKAIEEMRLKIANRKLIVESRTNASVDDKTALETIKTYNRFLDELTGYTAKERKKHLMEGL